MKLLPMYMKIIENYPQRKKIITNVGKEKCKGRFFFTGVTSGLQKHHSLGFPHNFIIHLRSNCETKAVLLFAVANPAG